MKTNETHLDEVRAAKQRRLEQLELQAAAYGRDTPPEISVEIADLRKELAGVEAVAYSSVSDETLKAMGQYGQQRAILVTVMGLVADFRDLKEIVELGAAESSRWRHRAQMILLTLFFLILFVAYNSWG